MVRKAKENYIKLNKENINLMNTVKNYMPVS